MVDEKNFFFLTTHRTLENTILGKNVSGDDIIQHTQIATDKWFCSQVTVKQCTVFSRNDSFKNRLSPNWEIQMDWEMTYNVIK